MSEFGIPYMGSKDKIIKSLALNFPKADHFYDLFGGGFSVTHFMLIDKRNKYKTFHYNEIQSNIVDLVRKAINGDYSYNAFRPEWISREDFFKYKENDAYIRLCWSFGNIEKTYLFGKDIEEYKRSMHMAVVFDEFNDIALDVFGFRKWPKEADTITRRRLYLRQRITYLNRKRKNHLKRGELEQLQQLQQLERLHQLQQLERLQRLDSLLFMTSKDYREVEILPNSIVYCDIPYKGTVGYRNAFSHKDFFDWAANAQFPVFISEYEVNDKRFELIYEIDKRSMLSAKDKDGALIKQERLYWNKK